MKNRKAKEITITGTLAENIAYYAEQADMQPEQYIEYVTTRIMMPLTILDLLDILPDIHPVYMMKGSSYRIYRGVPDDWMEVPINEIRSGAGDTLIIELEADNAQEDS